MTQVIKTIKGRKYAYDVKWDPERKKQIWTYQGMVEKKIDLEKLKGELYSFLFRTLSRNLKSFFLPCRRYQAKSLNKL